MGRRRSAPGVCVWPGLLPAAAADSVYACFPRGAALLLLLLLLLRCCCAAALI